ncbi:MAG TPA: RagB/SusD family nutrient uptake outer membrane protein, partial [Saprospiraceae bacterium]|nr:RagB/SusD family nutrient uptake outer membrane protein [Saprospiraceae bacterium]
TVFDTPARVQQQINGLYASVKNGNLLGGRFFVYNDVRADYFINETNNNVTGLSVWNHTVQPSNVNDVTNLWNTAYLAINRANVFIAGIDANTQKLRDSGLTDAQLNEFKAEARFLRALVYNSLLTLYASPFADGAGAKPGVPLQLNANVASGDNDLPRSSVAQVYAQILEDLNFAEANLPATRGNALNNSTRAIRSASIALKTRVFLHMQRYADVVTEANKLVSANPPYVAAGGVAHTLAPTVGEVFRTPWTHVERIFSFPFTENDLPGTQNGLGSYYNPGPRGIGDFSLNNSGIIGDTVNWITTDDRRAFIFRNTSNNKNYWNKFASGPQHLDYVPVLRYAEVLLNLAEASARTGNTDRALSLLNTVRTRSKGGEYEPFGTQAELVEAILKEREIELLGEGFRAPDLMRLLRPLPGKSNVGPVPSSSSGYIWPIPAGELIVNKAVVQNPGY